MNKSFVKLVSAALAFAWGPLLSGIATAAPVVVTPGTNAGYIYFPPASVGTGGGTGGGSSGGALDANTLNCSVSNIFPTVVTATSTGSVVIPKAVKCIYLEAGGGAGVAGVNQKHPFTPIPAGKGVVVSKVIFNNSGQDLTINWSMALVDAAGGAGRSGMLFATPIGGQGAGGAGAGIIGPGGIVLLAACGGGGGASNPDGSWPVGGYGGKSTGENGTDSTPIPCSWSCPPPLPALPHGALCTAPTNGLNGSGTPYVKYAY